MRPTHQRFEAGDAPARKIDQRLVIGPQRIALDGLAQLGFDLAAGLGARVHSGLEERECAARIVLGARQCEVGVLQKLLGFIAVAGRHRNADAGADHDGMPVQKIGIADGVQQAPRQERRILGPRHPALDDCEFVGVEPGQRIVVAQHRSQSLADAAQELVADAMAERIVDRLEMVEAEHEHRHLLGVAACAQQDVVHLLTQQIAVRQPGQAVMLGHESQPRLGAFAFGGVHQRQQDRRPVAVHELA